jgi:hypothetical protein
MEKRGEENGKSGRIRELTSSQSNIRRAGLHWARGRTYNHHPEA